MNDLIALEEVQLVEEGAGADAAATAAGEARGRLARGDHEDRVWAAFDGVPRRADWAFDEPSDLEGIRERRKGDRADIGPPDGADLADRLHGAWLGRCIGCALGKPVEGFMGPHGGLSSKDRLKTYLAAIDPAEYPIRGYIPGRSPAEEQTGRAGCPDSTRERIAFMETDDDIRYTVLGQCILEAHGPEFRSAHVVAAWLDRLPYRHVCTAETQAYRNVVLRGDAFRHPLSPETAADLDRTADWTWFAHHLNPYREWIGAQIRVDSYAYAAPGRPDLAAELAWRDARISHVKNGIYGAMFCAAAIAAAFALDDPAAVVEAGLGQIPAGSRLHADLTWTRDLCREAGERFDAFEAVFDRLYERLGRYHPAHTINNAALVVAALLLGGGDPIRAITLAVMGGWDTDCNGATVGSIVGAMTGAGRLPDAWTAPLHDTLLSGIAGYHPISIRTCAERSLRLAHHTAGPEASRP